VLIGAGRSCQLGGKLENAERYLQEAIAEANLRDDVVSGAEAMVRLFVVRWYRGDAAGSAALVSDAVALLEALPPGPPLAAAYTYSAEYALLAGRMTEGLAWAEKALSVAVKLGLENWAVEARAARGGARCELGDLLGMQDLRRAVSEGLGRGVGEATGIALSALAEWLWIAEGPGEAREAYEECVAFNERRGLTGQVYFDRAELLRVRCDLGEWNSVLDEAGEVIAWGRTNQGQVETVALIPYAYIRFHRGQLQEALSSKERFLPQAREIGDLQTLVPALVLAATIDGAAGNRKSALSLLEEWQAVTEYSDPWRARYLPSAMRVLSVHEPAKAESVIAGLNVTAFRDSNCLLTGQAIVAEARGDFRQAHDLNEEVALRWDRYGWVLEQGQAHLGQGRCSLALGAPREATESLQKARTILSNLGAVPLLTQTEGYLQESEAAS
jgi:tetratricopeptide (TPR) repeat protein